MGRIEISSNMEDYLEAISELVEQKGHAHVKDIAERMKVTMPSVTSALQALSTRNLLIYQSHSPVVLTRDGEETAQEIRRRHKELRKFFREILKLDEDEADKEACKMEHVVNERVMSRFVELVEAIVTRGDCAGLRDHLSAVMPQIAADDPEGLLSLDHLAEGRRAVIAQVAESLRGVRRFADLGIVPGTMIEMEGHAPFGDLLRIKVMGSSLSLRSNDAAYIWVKECEESDGGAL